MSLRPTKLLKRTPSSMPSTRRRSLRLSKRRRKDRQIGASPSLWWAKQSNNITDLIYVTDVIDVADLADVTDVTDSEHSIILIY